MADLADFSGPGGTNTAPKPQNAAGIGQWTEAYGVGEVDLPSGGTWTYDLRMRTDSETYVGVVAGNENAAIRSGHGGV